MNNNLIQVAIDGPAGSGKSTVANLLANKLNIEYINTGAIFRCFALKLSNLDFNDLNIIKQVLDNIKIDFIEDKIMCNNIDVTFEIGNTKIANLASDISKIPLVRDYYKKIIKSIIENNNVLMEGRDITTVILPNAKYKFYLTASIDARTLRRYEQYQKKIPLEQIKKQIIDRDYQDSHRKTDPLTISKDAAVIDSSNMSINEVVDHLYNLITKKDKKCKK